MQLGQTLYAVVFPDGTILNCWTSPNRLYDTQGAATRVLNQHILEAEDLLKRGYHCRIRRGDTPERLKEMAPERQKELDRLKSAKVKKVVIEIQKVNLS